MVSRILVALVAMSAVGLAAQQPPPPPAGLKTGNPTPGTPQPEPPNLAMRITVVGCVQATGNRSGGGAAANANTPSDARFVLTNAARTNVVPPGTGTATAGIESPDRIYRLHAIDSQLSPFVGAKVEISGEVLPSGSKIGGAPGKGGAQRNATSARPDAAASAPTVQVEFVQKLETKCS